MSPLDEQVEAITAILRVKGCVVGIDPDAPDYLKKAFLEMLLSSPRCRQTALSEHLL